MVEVHVLDAWLSPAAAAAGGATYHWLRFLGGLAAPGFLYMAGLSQALADASLAARGASPAERRRVALRRGLWLLGVAYGFRLVEFLVGGAFLKAGGWEDVLRVDVLNVIAVSLLLAAFLGAGQRRRVAIPLLGGVAVAIVLLTPAVAEWTAARPPSRVLDYLYASWPRALFHVFNWSAFLLAGAALGPLAVGRGRPLAFLAAGAILLGAGALAQGLELHGTQSYWRTSPAWFLHRLGICVAATGVLQLVPAAVERLLARRTAWLSLLGRESLVAYVASVELTYGVLAHPLKKALSLPTVMTGMVAMTGLTWAACAGWVRVREVRRARAAASAPVAPA